MDLKTLREIEKRHAKRIAEYLLEQIEVDELLKTKLLETEKTLQQCVEYVKEQAKKQAEDNMAWISDDEVYGWVVDFYLDDNIKAKKEIKAPKPKETTTAEKKPQVIEKKPESKKETKEEIQKKLYGEIDLFSI